MGRGRGRAGGGSRIGAFLFWVGGLSVLGATFAAGAVADRYWLTRSAVARPLGAGDIRAAERREHGAEARDRAAAGTREPASRKSRGERAAPVPEPTPKLTFYEELTAPLTPAPLPPRPAKGERPEKSSHSAGATAGEAKVRSGEEKIERVDRTTPGPARFTVQLGAFRSRPQAEAIRATLAGAGHDAYVSAIDGPDGPRYRVRVGSYPTREEARRAATRLEATRVGGTYVTIR